MNPDNPFYGLVCPILTPFDENGQIDASAARKLVDFLVEQEVDGLMPGGTTGEGMLLTIEERKRLAEIVVEQAAGRTKVIVHTGCISTAETVELSVHARQVGADAVSVITPYFYAFNDEALFKHYLAVAEAVPDTPISLYCYPDNAKQMISTELVCRLRRAAPNILAIKFSSVDLIQFQEYIAAGGDGFHALCGCYCPVGPGSRCLRSGFWQRQCFSAAIQKIICCLQSRGSARSPPPTGGYQPYSSRTQG
jgi:4-hydroxy-tetrahydrodipicolinate synthase